MTPERTIVPQRAAAVSLSDSMAGAPFLYPRASNTIASAPSSITA